ncbi:MAG: transcription termination/antitermination protein NusG [candidate division WWE3 bacterium]|nr:transcription termination/antitermination protein NusG [candidate division WWE3 bacterium]
MADTPEEKKDNLVRISEPTENSRWYVVHTYSGHEVKVCKTLQQRAASFDLAAKINEILVPTQEKIAISEGKKRKVDERLFPGYVMVHMEMTDATWFLVRSTAGVTGFVGTGDRPTPIPLSEVNSILKFIKSEAPKFEAKYTVGDSVKIVDGPFADFVGAVDEINEEQGKVKVLVSVFGRETPVELDFLQVAPL